MRSVPWLVLAGVCCVSGCAGNGEGLNANGRPGSGTGAPLTATLQSIQENVFTPICTQCHAGAAAPLGLRLDEASAYAMLVNAPSVEQGSLNRVTPGDPDSSYLIQKLEGTAASGAQMPLGQPPLPPATINAIRQWIANGAPKPAATSDVIPTQVRSVSPLAGQMLNPAEHDVLLESARTLDVATLNDSNVTLTRSGGNGSFGDADDANVGPVRVEVRSLSPTVLALKLAEGTFVPDRYRLTISGGGPQPVRDTDGLAIGDFVLEFNVGDTL